ncbi:MAG: hypothetical protein AB8B55_06970 [Mariniblastus sp.]
MDDSLNNRGRAMEDAFFAKSDQALLEKMRAELSAQESRQALKAASGISDEAVLDALHESGITPETLTSVSLIPLVAVAWADKKMEDAEKAAILKAADVAGIKSGSASYSTMEAWLSDQPTGELLDTWKAYIGSLKPSLDAAAFNQLKTSIIERAENVAESAGGFLGLGDKVSAAERTVLDDLAAAFN